MREAIAGLDRFLVTVEVAKYRFFRWAPADVLPSGSLVVFARADDLFLGVLESRFHKLWASETHNPLENRAALPHRPQLRKLSISNRPVAR
jgi:hypothetical protein